MSKNIITNYLDSTTHSTLLKYVLCALLLFTFLFFQVFWFRTEIPDGFRDDVMKNIAYSNYNDYNNDRTIPSNHYTVSNFSEVSAVMCRGGGEEFQKYIVTLQMYWLWIIPAGTTQVSCQNFVIL